MRDLDQFIAYLEEQVRNHSIYVWGAQGQAAPTITEAWIRARETGEENAQRAIAYFKKQVAAGYGNVLRAFDCSGLGMYYLKNLQGIYKSDMSSNTMMGTCKRITKSALTRGDWVFRTDMNGKAYHIGYVVDDNKNVIECKGRDDGCIKRKIDAHGDAYWNAYGRPAAFAQAALADDNTLRMGDTGIEVIRLQELLLHNGYKLPLYGADGEFGAETEAAVKACQAEHGLACVGVVNAATWAALEAYYEEGPVLEPGWPYYAACTGASVYVRAGRGTQHSIIGTAHKDDKLLALPGQDGWCKISVYVGGDLIVGYMSEKYIRRIQHG